MLYEHFRNYGCRLHTDYSYKNLRVAILENDLLRVSVLVDKGADIFELLYKQHETSVEPFPGQIDTGRCIEESIKGGATKPQFLKSEIINRKVLNLFKVIKCIRNSHVI
jgi:hypothetical protein